MTPLLSDPPASAPQCCVSFPVGGSIIHDTWHTGGLRATGSNDIEVTDVFVPNTKTFLISAASDRPSQYHQCAIWTPIAAVALGIGRRAIDTVVGISSAKTPVGRSNALRDQPVLQAEVAKAEAAVRSARSWLYATATRSAAYAVDVMHLSAGDLRFMPIVRSSVPYGTCIP